jgi:hypothetical protein
MIRPVESDVEMLKNDNRSRRSNMDLATALQKAGLNIEHCNFVLKALLILSGGAVTCDAPLTL